MIASRQLRMAAAAAGGIALAFGLAVAQEADEDKFIADAPPERFVGPNTEINKELGCSKCHLEEFKAWQTTHHNHSIGMPDTPLAKAMRKKFKIRNLQRDKLCQNCHFTVVKEGGEEVAKYGISCESCHGPAAEWAGVHSNEEKWGKDQREVRLKLAEEKGMIRPANLYKLAQNCYQCHIMAKNPQGTTVSVEEMVNTKFKVKKKKKKKKKKKYHRASTKGFELVAYSQGEVRHNLRNKARENRPSRFLRGLYVVGKMLDVEYSLRALSNATDPDGRYFKKIKERLDGEGNALAALEAIRSKLPGDHPVAGAIDEIVAAAKAAPLEVKQREALLAAASKVRAAARRIFDGKSEEEMLALEKELAPVDPLLPPPEKYKGTPYQVTQ
ncbi:MAG: hypothetical protein D6731_22315 [Planctomycetota bacterium]|nr:MAG: hypothetical protein D6731_22315 [Planctomycetota bacterium]